MRRPVAHGGFTSYTAQPFRGEGGDPDLPFEQGEVGDSAAGPLHAEYPCFLG